MRDDPTRSTNFQNLELWNEQKYTERLLKFSEPDPTGQKIQPWKFTSNSLSGRERNRLFLRNGNNFSDVTLLSGADDMADGRSFGLIDFDGDGWQDIALMSLNAPRFKLYRNQLKPLYSDNRPFRFRLIGGQRDANSSTNQTNRDAIGARVLLTYKSGKKVMMHKQAGEGFASQNSETLSIGVPAGDSVLRMEVRWPSGESTVVESPDSSDIVTVHENSADPL